MEMHFLQKKQKHYSRYTLGCLTMLLTIGNIIPYSKYLICND